MFSHPNHNQLAKIEMASPKSLFLLIALVFALALLISSEAANKETTSTTGIEDAKYGDGGFDNGGGNGGGGYGGRGGRGNGGGRYPPRCPYGCCYGCCRSYRYRQGCKRCCSSVNEAPDAFFADELHN